VDKFLCVPVSPLRLKEFYQESIDLREIYENPESDELFYAEIGGEIKDIQLTPIARESLPEEWLPERDFYFKKDNVAQSSPTVKTIYQLSEEQLKELLDLLKYKPLLEILSKQHKMAKPVLLP